MRIVYALTWPYTAGGTVRTVVTQAGALAEAGHDVAVLGVYRTREDTHFAYHPRVRLTTLVDARDSGAVGEEPGVLVPRGEPQYRHFTRRVEDAVLAGLAEVDADVLVTTRPALNLLAADHLPGGPGRPVRVGQEHLALSGHRADVRAAIVDAYPALDAVVTLTERDRADYRAALPSGTAVSCIPNPLLTLDVPPADPSARLVVAAGRLDPVKRFDRLIEAFGRVVVERPDWRLRIYGDGPERAELLKLIRRRHLYNHVFLMGATDALPREMARASVVAVSSRFEGFSMVLAEGMAHGLAAVSFDCPTGPGEIVTHERDGLLVPPADVTALADALLRVTGDEELRRRLGARARESVRRFAPDTVRARWEGLFGALRGLTTP